MHDGSFEILVAFAYPQFIRLREIRNMQFPTGSKLERLVRGATIAVVIAGSLSLAAAGGGREARHTCEAPEVPTEIDWYAIERDWPWMNRLDRAEWDRLFPAGRLPPNPIAPCSNPTITRPDFPSELCLTATLPGGTPINFPVVTQNRTVGRLDFIDLGVDGACAGGGPQFTGTGMGPDLSYKVRVDVECDLQVTVRMVTTLAEECEPDPDQDPPPPDPLEPWDVALYIIREPVLGPDDDPILACFDPASKCVRVSDGGGIGAAETVTFTASTTEVYYVMVDGFTGSSGYFEIDISEDGSTGCKLSR